MYYTLWRGVCQGVIGCFLECSHQGLDQDNKGRAEEDEAKASKDEGGKVEGVLVIFHVIIILYS